MSIRKSAYGHAPGGEPVDLFTMSNRAGMEVGVLSYGGVVVAVRVPDRFGRFADVVLGYDTMSEYAANPPYLGALIGRFGNRIAGGTFALDGTTYTLARNNGANHLHGGIRGFDKVVWDAAEVVRQDGAGLQLSYTSPHGEEGYPGALDVTVTYLLGEDNSLTIDYRAETDAPTIVNLTNHSYFNLKGEGRGDVLSHELTLYASAFTPVNEQLIPTGELRSVRGTPMDFTTPTAIGTRIDADDEQLRLGGGYDHNFVLDEGAADNGDAPALAARVYEPIDGRVLEVLTTAPGVQLYTGNFLEPTPAGKGGKPYDKRFGLCLETQHFPDSPNQTEFPSPVLRPGEVYTSTTVFRFSAR